MEIVKSSELQWRKHNLPQVTEYNKSISQRETYSSDYVRKKEAFKNQ